MTTPWSDDDLTELDRAQEVDVAGRRADGRLLRFTPIWVVRVGDDVFARTQVPRTTGWYGHAAGSGRAQLRVGGRDVDVEVDVVGAGDAALRDAVDQAYRAKYHGAGSMVSDVVAGTTLRFRPADPTGAPGD